MDNIFALSVTDNNVIASRSVHALLLDKYLFHGADQYACIFCSNFVRKMSKCECEHMETSG
jgi:hypothetical protein